ncbi:hypothetical protein [Streptomyces sp. NPDC059564]|uniref:hypothetical protein n=1 Tax=Streptomyces sp. NPDC059564 TaxID=3346865 RepID=UPI0036BEEE00
MLRCATPGIYFEATFAIEWRPALRTRPNLEDLVLSQALSAAGEVARRFEAVEVRTAQDTINAELGTPQHTRADAYRCLGARVKLALSETARENVAQLRADEARVRRLRFLRTNLYEHPDLFVLDRIERQADFPGSGQVADWQRLARWIVASNEWWQPVLEQWESVGRGFDDIELQNRAMLALCEALRTLTDEKALSQSPTDTASIRRSDAAQGRGA